MISGYVICGGFAFVFWIWGLRGLISRKMTVVNPRSRAAFGGGVIGALLARGAGANPNELPYEEASGSRAVGMSVLFLLLAVAFTAALGLLAWNDFYS